MEQSKNTNVPESNVFQAIQKNKIIQGQLIDRQRLYDIQLVKDMKDYDIEEKYNRDLLYTWKKETYLRQLKKSLQEYEYNKTNITDAFYEYQVRNLDHITSNRPGLIIPPREEERRLNIKMRYEEFLQKNPIQTLSSVPIDKTTNNIPKQNQNQNQPDEDEIARSLEQTWKHIQTQTANVSTEKQHLDSSTLHRSLTLNDIRRNKTNPIRSMTASNVLGRTTSNIDNLISNEKSQQSLIRPRSNHFESHDKIESLSIAPNVLNKYTHSDLYTIRSIRRPKQNPIDLSYIYETRRRICQINKRSIDWQILKKKCYNN
ncbi:unnamed protein product [Adineta steineri]|uniref:Uncharacterized protein n=1 Tax=Adineta steineri TaxID=433720 RepID=A0A813W9D4_9BILA|nr:unnamed protein product [Adineta steineri]